MEFSQFFKALSQVVLVLLFVQMHSGKMCFGARKLSSLYIAPPMVVKYHNGPLLEGTQPVSILWYGKFTPSQKSIVVDFLLSLHPQKGQSSSTTTPLISQWWETIDIYMKKAGKKNTLLTISSQESDEACSLGKNLKKSQISELAHRVNPNSAGLTLVLTAQDVLVEGFCMSYCGFHDSDSKKSLPYIWVGNSVTQCPGQCAWPFYRPIYGPQTTPLVAPNGDVGMDGMVVNIGSLLAGAVTNPYGTGYYQGTAEAHLEAASACPGMFGPGSYPGFAGELLVDKTTGSSYNAVGTGGKKFLVPGLFNPSTSQCETIL